MVWLIDTDVMIDLSRANADAKYRGNIGDKYRGTNIGDSDHFLESS
jgi:hypothetical protein